jgi:hypothetical protein
LKPDLCIYCGVRGVKHIANSFPEEDYEHINETIINIKKIMPKKFILISTVDVLDLTENVDEDHDIKIQKLEPYGKNRRLLEIWVKKNILDYNIIRLPAIYGLNLKKNFIYDIVNPIPKLLNTTNFLRYSEKSALIYQSYLKINNFYYLNNARTPDQKVRLNNEMDLKNTSSLYLTDSRAIFQFYPLKHLAKHIINILDQNIKVSHLVTEPLSAGEVFEFLNKKVFINEMAQKIPNYKIDTKYRDFWNQKSKFLFDKHEILQDIKEFVLTMKKNGV